MGNPRTGDTQVPSFGRNVNHKGNGKQFFDNDNGKDIIDDGKQIFKDNGKHLIDDGKDLDLIDDGKQIFIDNGKDLIDDGRPLFIDNDKDLIEPCESDACRLERRIRERLAFAPEIPYIVGQREFLLPPTHTQTDIAATAAAAAAAALADKAATAPAAAAATTTNRPSFRHTPLGLGLGRRRR